MRVYVTFSGAFYDGTTQLIVDNATRLGADRLIVYDDAWLTQQPFYRLNHWLWEHHQRRGFGWYCWKPYIIYHTLSQLDDGDIVLFSDADTYPVGDLCVLYDRCKADGGIMLFAANPFHHVNWCKRDCLIVMGQDSPEYRFRPAGVARMMLFEKGPWAATQFLMEWITYCVNPLATTFDPSVLAPEYPELSEHRTEQAIMTNLAHKYGLKLYRCADQYGNQSPDDWDIFPQLFVQYDAPGAEVHVTHAIQGSRYQNVADLRREH